MRYTRTPTSGIIRTNRNQRAFAQPDRSWLRKMSMKIQMMIQIQITQRKNSKSDQKISRTEKFADDAASDIPAPHPGRPPATTGETGPPPGTGQDSPQE